MTSHFFPKSEELDTTLSKWLKHYPLSPKALKDNLIEGHIRKKKGNIIFKTKCITLLNITEYTNFYKFFLFYIS